MLVVLLIVGVLAAVAAPRLFSQRQCARVATAVTTIQAVQNAASLYQATNGGWPPDAVHGVCPTQLSPYLRNHKVFTQPTPLGGFYDWNLNWTGAPFRANMSIYWSSDYPPQICQQIDDRYDHGNAGTGAIRFESTGGQTRRIFFEGELW